MPDFIKGWNLPPWVAGVIRAVILAAAYAAINAAIIFFTATSDPMLLAYQIPIVGFLRVLEGILDQAMKPRSNEHPPAVEG